MYTCIETEQSIVHFVSGIETCWVVRCSCCLQIPSVAKKLKLGSNPKIVPLILYVALRISCVAQLGMLVKLNLPSDHMVQIRREYACLKCNVFSL